MARWLSWLERRPVTAEVVGSNPIRVAISIIYNLYRGGRKHIKLAFSTSLFFSWDLSSAGRASALQAGGHRFEPCRSHLYFLQYKWKKWIRRCGSIQAYWRMSIRGEQTSEAWLCQLSDKRYLKLNTPMWLNWQSSWFVISRLTVRVRSSALMGRFPSGQRGQTVNLLALPSKVRILLCPLLFN